MLQSPQGAQGLLRVTRGRQPGIWGTAAELGALRVLPSIARSSWRWGGFTIGACGRLGPLQDTGGLTSMGRLVPLPSSACRFYKLY